MSKLCLIAEGNNNRRDDAMQEAAEQLKGALESLFSDAGSEVGDQALYTSAMSKLCLIADGNNRRDDAMQEAAEQLKGALESLFSDAGSEVGDHVSFMSTCQKLETVACMPA
eukprot:TRINITY_DN2584_c0_g1_i7.p2 TRINITY_DN2584_c0_g1~~TRINITY_DN2584_c0_g1_i7.p2  ORF type:complete len:112 (+),score=30.95 TRINITY_DN2584_c0_g1_i7:592-927(+)